MMRKLYLEPLRIACMALILFSPTPSQAWNSNEEKNFLEKSEEVATVHGSALFTPPPGWKLADPEALLKSVKVMVVGKGSYEFPPSMNLGSEPFQGTLKQYLDKIKSINAAKGAEWKNLGTIRTQAGNASLSQLDTITAWGAVRMMHVIMIYEGTAYILTAASLKEEFPKFYKDFFKSLQSFRINKS